MMRAQDPQRRGPWQPAEDTKLLGLIDVHGPENWVKLSELVGTRTAKQCRERYHQKLKPDLDHSPITDSEGVLIEQLQKKMGPRWAEIARVLGNRSDNAVKNYWNGSQNRQKREEQKRHRQQSRASHSRSHSRPQDRDRDQCRRSLHLQQPLPPSQFLRSPTEYHHHHAHVQRDDYARLYTQQQHHHQLHQHHQRSPRTYYASPISPTRPSALEPTITLPAVRVPTQPTCNLPPLYPDRPQSQHGSPDGAAHGSDHQYPTRRPTALSAINTVYRPLSSPRNPHWPGYYESPLSSPESATFDQSRLNYSHNDAAEWRPATRDSSATVGSAVAPSTRCYQADQCQRDVPRMFAGADDSPVSQRVLPTIEGRDVEEKSLDRRDPRMTLNKILC